MRSQRPKQLVFVLAGAVTFAMSCAMSHAERIDDSRLAGIPETQKQPITVAQGEVNQAQQDQEVAKQGKVDAETQLKLAKSEQDVAQARFDQVKQQRDIELKAMHDREAAQFKGTAPEQQPQEQASSEVQPAQPQQLVTPADFQQASVALDTAKAKVVYLSKLVDVSKSGSTLADRKLELANAKLDLARFQVLNTVNPAEVEAMKLNEAQFDSEVAKKQAKVADAESKFSQQRVDARQAYDKWSGLDQQLSQLSGPNYRRADVPPPPRG